MIRLKAANFINNEENDTLEESIVCSPDESFSPNDLESKNVLCRLCAGEALNPVFIYSEIGESMKLADKINNYLSIKIKKTDPLPKQLCGVCVEKIIWCDQFDNQCIKAEKVLSTEFQEQIHNFTEFDKIDKKCCPLCIDGCMNFCSLDVDAENLGFYDSDLILESCDEERQFKNLSVKNSNIKKTDLLQYFDNNQQYLKCGACMNLYLSQTKLEEHKCKPIISNTSKSYKCPNCDVIFTFEERLNFHMRFHYGAKALYCEICNLTFSKELKLFYHYKRYHFNDTSVSCLQCGKLFENKQIIKTHICVDGKTRPHVCDICGKGFSDGYTLKRHIAIHLPEKPYKCSQCSKSFTQKSRLNKHIASHEVIIDNTQSIWKCIHCGMIFHLNEDANIHCKLHENQICMIEQLTVSKIYHCEFCESHFNNADELKIHQNLHVVERPYSCNICNLIFKSFVEANLHWKGHSKIFNIATFFLCDICDKDMKELSLLYKHKQKRHCYLSRKSELHISKFICELCGSLFDTCEEIKIHAHEQCSKFPCDICGSVLLTANSLNVHKRKHSGLRPYVCNICGKSYTQSSHMWTHKRFHIGVKPYACEYCDQRFTIKPDLADHTRKKHTRERPFKCEVCNKAFLTGSVFYQHRLIHREDRRYKCHYCEKTFTRTEALNNHIKIHTGEKPHACDICGRCFRQKGDMRKHKKTQHSALRVKCNEMSL